MFLQPHSLCKDYTHYTLLFSLQTTLPLLSRVQMSSVSYSSLTFISVKWRTQPAPALFPFIFKSPPLPSSCGMLGSAATCPHWQLFPALHLVTLDWSLGISHSRSIHITEIGKYKVRVLLFLESQLLNMYLYTTTCLSNSVLTFSLMDTAIWIYRGLLKLCWPKLKHESQMCFSSPSLSFVSFEKGTTYFSVSYV